MTDKFFGDINIDRIDKISENSRGERVMFFDMWIDDNYSDPSDTGIIGRIAVSQTTEERMKNPKRNYIGVVRRSKHSET